MPGKVTETLRCECRFAGPTLRIKTGGAGGMEDGGGGEIPASRDPAGVLKPGGPAELSCRGRRGWASKLLHRQVTG